MDSLEALHKNDINQNIFKYFNSNWGSSVILSGLSEDRIWNSECPC